MNEKLSEILAKLKNVKQIKENQWQASCPAHDDKKPSLTATQEKDGKLLLYCHAGCSVNDITAALGIEVRDLFPDKPARRDFVAVYDYKDEAGNLLFQVCRTVDKQFPQRRPDGRGEWVYNLQGVKRTIYRLPEVLKAVKAGEIVFIPEGEKDADNLARLGLTATCNPGGAGKWKKEYTEYFHGARVVILPDNDGPGRKHADQVARSLYGKAKSVKILDLSDLPEKGDVSDWLQGGGTKEDLLILAEEAPEWKPKPKNRKKKDEDEEEKKPKQTSFLHVNGKLYEQVHINGVSMFAEYDPATGKVNAVESIEADGETYIPIDGEEIELRAILLPSGVVEYGETLDLLQEIEEYINRYLDISQSFRKFASYYILLSYLFDRFNTIPYLRAIGDTGCGKSRFLDVIGMLCYKPIQAAGCITPAPIFRMLRKWGGTLVLDEADLKNSDEYNEVITILNCGFERGRAVIRATKDNPDKLQFFPVYGPKVFATRRRFKDAALEARCLTEVMQETTREDIPPVLGMKFQREQEELRNKLLLFRFRNWHKVDPEQEINIKLAVEPRLKQVSYAFMSLFANQEDVLTDYTQFISEHQKEIIEQRLSTPVGIVVENFLARTTDTYATIATLATGEQVLSFSAKDISEDVGIDTRTVGQILKTLGLKTKQMKREGKVRRCFIYDETKIKALQRRYSLPDEEGGGSNGSNGSTSSGLREIKNLDLESLDFEGVIS